MPPSPTHPFAPQVTYLGRHQAGQEVPLWVLCTSTMGVPSNPDAAPTVDVYSDNGLALAQVKVPVLEPAATLGLFEGHLYLSDAFTAGRYSLHFRWQFNGSELGQVAVFEVAAGGDGSGQVLTLTYYHRPHADYLVQQRTSGRIYKGKNPRI